MGGVSPILRPQQAPWPFGRPGDLCVPVPLPRMPRTCSSRGQAVLQIAPMPTPFRQSLG